MEKKVEAETMAPQRIRTDNYMLYMLLSSATMSILDMLANGLRKEKMGNTHNPVENAWILKTILDFFFKYPLKELQKSH